MIKINDIDWNEAWNSTHEEDKNFIKCIDRWADISRCRRFDNAVKSDNYAGSQERIKAMNITTDSRVLDVGAGPGTLAIPLSRIVKHVTAVEPSPGMITCLKDNISEFGIKNIDVIEKMWEDVKNSDLTTPYDIVFASYSLGVSDLRSALDKLNKVSSRFVYIFWFADMESPWRHNYRDIWEKLFGVSARDGRQPNIIYNLLTQMGIYANVEITKEERCLKFTDLNAAVEDQAEGLKLTTDEQIITLRDFLKTRLEREGEFLVLKRNSSQSKIWWEKEI